MADREADGHAERARARDGSGRPHRQRGNGHEVIGAEPVQKSKSESGRSEEHAGTIITGQDRLDGRDWAGYAPAYPAPPAFPALTLIVQETGTDAGK